MSKTHSNGKNYVAPRIVTLEAREVVEALGPASAGYPVPIPVTPCQTTNPWGRNYCGDCTD